MKRFVVGRWLVCLVLAHTLFVFSAIAVASDKMNRTLFGNRAVQRELQLSEEQQAKTLEILTEMEDEIAVKVKAAAVEKGDADDVELKVAEAAIRKHGPRLQALLTQQQSLRLWQIGAQGAGAAVFNNDRVRRVLNLTPAQMEKMSSLGKDMVAKVTNLATDPTKDLREIEQKAEAAKQDFFEACLALLNADQRRDFDELLGKPFDRELLQRSDGTKPRALTFIFGLSGQNYYVLANIPPTQQELKLSIVQVEQIQSLLKKADEGLTAVRLGQLKDAKAEFAELDPEEQRRIVKAILEGASLINLDTGRKVTAILDARQRDVLNQSLVKLIGARAIECEAVAALLKLSVEQKAAFAKLSHELEDKTAPMRVVRNQREFDHRAFDMHLAELESAARAILTEEQRQRLDSLSK